MQEAQNRSQQLLRLRAVYGDPPPSAQTYREQMDYYRQVMASGYRTGGGMRRLGPR